MIHRDRRRRRRNGSRKKHTTTSHTNKYYKNRHQQLTAKQYTEIVATYTMREWWSIPHQSKTKQQQQQINTLNFQRRAYTHALCSFCVFRSFHPAPLMPLTHSHYHNSLSIRHCPSIKWTHTVVSILITIWARVCVCVCDDVLSAQNHFYYQVIYTICSQIQLIKLTHIQRTIYK